MFGMSHDSVKFGMLFAGFGAVRFITVALNGVAAR
jgi:hypothetical protein